jgi:hypothetical protein
LSNHNRQVSIHAPTRGATKVVMLSVVGSLVSIHAPTRGATDVRRIDPFAYWVSIHAPTRGATSATAYLLPTQFQSTPPRGGRLYTVLPCTVMFQSTPPRGGRRHASDTISVAQWFNPRPPRGATSSMPPASPAWRVSIHAPTRGDYDPELRKSYRHVSIHAPTRWRPIPYFEVSRALRFQSTPPRGGDSRAGAWFLF